MLKVKNIHMDTSGLPGAWTNHGVGLARGGRRGMNQRHGDPWTGGLADRKTRVQPKQTRYNSGELAANAHRAHGVMVSHPLRMRKALGSIPSVSIFERTSNMCLQLVDERDLCPLPERRRGRSTAEEVARTVCPSGLRGWTQVPLARAAWVQIPQLSFLRAGSTAHAVAKPLAAKRVKRESEEKRKHPPRGSNPRPLG